jgi:MinD-like ATPase involved in chromosome partitioning or flagellar assembly
MTIASVLSTKGGPGKTTVTANLGAFCADAGIRTLLIVPLKGASHAQRAGSDYCRT